MNDLHTFINIQQFLEELDNNDKSYFVLYKQTDEYDLYFDKHLFKRQNRHFEWDGSTKITSSSVIKDFNKAYSQIINKYQSNKLSYSKTGKEAFLITNKLTNLNIVGFIYKLNTNGKYDICLKSVMNNDKFYPKNGNGFKTIQILLESKFNLITVNLDE